MASAHKQFVSAGETYTRPTHTHANYTSEAEHRDLRCLGSEILSKAKVLPHDIPGWLFLV